MSPLRSNCKHIDSFFPKNSPRSSRINTILKFWYLQHGSSGNIPLDLDQRKFSDIYVKYIEYLIDTIRRRKSIEDIRSDLVTKIKILCVHFLIHDENGVVVGIKTPL